ncbi:MAG: hypothetical protein VKJ06_08925 [Vampirovibrionales bacterium]|nr:hypothetical protein [Vampirovibrionales bacterium]
MSTENNTFNPAVWAALRYQPVQPHLSAAFKAIRDVHSCLLSAPEPAMLWPAVLMAVTAKAVPCVLVVPSVEALQQLRQKYAQLLAQEAQMVCWHEAMMPHEQRHAAQQWQAGQCQMLVVTASCFSRPQVQGMLAYQPVQLLVIDTAEALLGFNAPAPAYATMNRALKKMNLQAQLVLLTAMLPEAFQNEILTQFGLLPSVSSRTPYVLTGTAQLAQNFRIEALPTTLTEHQRLQQFYGFWQRFLGAHQRTATPVTLITVGSRYQAHALASQLGQAYRISPVWVAHDFASAMAALEDWHQNAEPQSAEPLCLMICAEADLPDVARAMNLYTPESKRPALCWISWQNPPNMAWLALNTLRLFSENTLLAARPGQIALLHCRDAAGGKPASQQPALPVGAPAFAYHPALQPEGIAALRAKNGACLLQCLYAAVGLTHLAQLPCGSCSQCLQPAVAKGVKAYFQDALAFLKLHF